MAQTGEAVSWEDGLESDRRTSREARAARYAAVAESYAAAAERYALVGDRYATVAERDALADRFAPRAPDEVVVTDRRPATRRRPAAARSSGPDDPRERPARTTAAYDEPRERPARASAAYDEPRERPAWASAAYDEPRERSAWASAAYEEPSANATGGVPGRRTVTIRGQGSLRGPAARSRPRPERYPAPTGHHPDRAAMWAVMLGVMLIVVALASAHAVTL